MDLSSKGSTSDNRMVLANHFDILGQHSVASALRSGVAPKELQRECSIRYANDLLDVTSIPTNDGTLGLAMLLGNRLKRDPSELLGISYMVSHYLHNS